MWIQNWAKKSQGAIKVDGEKGMIEYARTSPSIHRILSASFS
jgi:hypothetical protein